MIIILLFCFVFLPYFRPILIQENSNLSPYFEPNDRILVSALPYRFREPVVGDIVYYSIPVEKLSSRYSSGERAEFASGEVIERIIGMPGNIFFLKNLRFWKNEVLLPKDLYPLGMVGLTKETELEFTIPADCYFIYLSTPFTSQIDGGRRLSASIVPKENIKGKVVFRYSPSFRWLIF
ncbi:MAG: signal peptidase I [bacterium]|nr:signal peptidase I [bacterium]